eukprot:Colp12_sorted_trinity150504_noHs@30985
MCRHTRRNLSSAHNLQAKTAQATSLHAESDSDLVQAGEELAGGGAGRALLVVVLVAVRGELGHLARDVLLVLVDGVGHGLVLPGDLAVQVHAVEHGLDEEVVVVVEVQAHQHAESGHEHEEGLHGGDVLAAVVRVDRGDDQRERGQASVLDTEGHAVRQAHEALGHDERHGGPDDSCEARVGEALTHQGTHGAHVGVAEQRVHDHEHRGGDGGDDRAEAESVHDAAQDGTEHGGDDVGDGHDGAGLQLRVRLAVAVLLHAHVAPVVVRAVDVAGGEVGVVLAVGVHEGGGDGGLVPLGAGAVNGVIAGCATALVLEGQVARAGGLHEVVALQQQGGGDVVEREHAAIDDHADEGHDPEDVLEGEHLGELGLLLGLLLGLVLVDQALAQRLLRARVGVEHHLRLLLVGVQQQAVGALLVGQEGVHVAVDGGHQHGTGHTGAAQDYTEPKGKLNIDVVSKGGGHQVVDHGTQTGDRQVDAERKRKLLALEPLRENGTVGNTHALSTNTINHTSQKHDGPRLHADTNGENQLSKSDESTEHHQTDSGAKAVREVSTKERKDDVRDRVNRVQQGEIGLKIVGLSEIVIHL